MKLFGRWYLLSLKAQLKRAEGYFAILLMAFVTFFFCKLNLPQKDNLTVGIFCEDSAQAKELITILETQNSIYQFILMPTESQLKKEVMDSTIECGFVLDQNYKEAFARGEQTEVMTYYCSGLTSKGMVAKETVYLALYKVLSSTYVKANLNELYKNPSEEVYDLIENYENGYLNGSELFTIREEYVGESTGTQTKTTQKTYPIWGSNFLILFLLIFFVRGDILSKEKAGYPLVLSKRESFWYSFARCLAAATLPAIACITLGIFFGEPFHEGLVIAFVGYSILWCQLLAMLLKKESRYFASFLAVVLFMLFLSPVYFDSSILFPVVRILKIFTPLGAVLW